jgi:hypothetical protein
MMVRVYCPVGEQQEGFLPLAPRPVSLEGRKVGLLWNKKANGDVYLREFRDFIDSRYPGVEFEWFAKSSHSRAPSSEMMLGLRTCDAVVTTVGD